MTITIFIILSYILLSFSLMPLFKKAGRNPQKALIPGVNFVEWNEIVGRPKWKAALLLIPIYNIFVYATMCVDMVRSFGKYSFWHSAAAVIYAPAIFFAIGRNSQDEYLGPIVEREKAYEASIQEAKQKGQDRKLERLKRNNPYHKGPVREWTEAIIFAVFAAAFIRMFLIEAYKIPTSSMEGSLLVGDFLFVSKAHYGIRTPKTVLMIPLLHNIIPGLGSESYLSSPNLKMRRLPKLENIDRNDPIVFNYPEGDSVYVTPGRVYSVHDAKRNPAVAKHVSGYKMRVRPVDKRDHYIKRAIAVAGDQLEIKNRKVFIDGVEQADPAYVQFRYLVKFSHKPSSQKLESLGISKEDLRFEGLNPEGPKHMMMVLNQTQIAALKDMDPTIKIIPNDMYMVSIPPNYDKSKLVDMGISDAHFRFQRRDGVVMTLKQSQVDKIKEVDPSLKIERFTGNELAGLTVFPHNRKYFADWNVDNYGPILIPAAGMTVPLTPENKILYRRVIKDYEGNEVSEREGQFIINGQAADSYTFRQDYYWGMGDNRDNSEDSRIWGFVPADHIVGKPLFIWMSTGENGIRFDRIFTSADKFTN